LDVANLILVLEKPNALPGPPPYESKVELSFIVSLSGLSPNLFQSLSKRFENLPPTIEVKSSCKPSTSSSKLLTLTLRRFSLNLDHADNGFVLERACKLKLEYELSI